MASIKWTDAMSVGVPILDSDHQEFFRIIEVLERNAKFPTGRDAIKELLVMLGDYAKYHFAREEKVMQDCGYPGLDEHKSKHAEFVDYIDGVVRRFNSDPNADVGEELLSFLKHWLKYHILKHDMAYRPYVEGNDRAKSAAKTFPPLYSDAF